MRPLRKRVVVADDSAVLRRLLCTYFEAEPDLVVVGQAASGEEALARVLEHRPDVLTLDLGMPGTGGLESLRRIMHRQPTPTVVITGASGPAATQTLQALDAGAVDFALKFTPGHQVDRDVLRREIVGKVRAAARVRVVRSLGPALALSGGVAPEPRRASFGPTSGIVVIGASTGGPSALRTLLAELPVDFPIPILVVQHVPEAFTSVLATQLDRHVAIRVREGCSGDVIEPGLALVAPGGFHTLVGRDNRLEVRSGPAICGHCPSIDVTVQSAVQRHGAGVIAVLLTGMGSDGAEGARVARSCGAAVLAQSPDSCVVYGIPRLAIERGCATHVGSPAVLAAHLRHLADAAGRSAARVSSGAAERERSASAFRALAPRGVSRGGRAR